MVDILQTPGFRFSSFANETPPSGSRLFGATTDLLIRSDMLSFESSCSHLKNMVWNNRNAKYTTGVTKYQNKSSITHKCLVLAKQTAGQYGALQISSQSSGLAQGKNGYKGEKTEHWDFSWPNSFHKTLKESVWVSVTTAQITQQLSICIPPHISCESLHHLQSYQNLIF